MSTESSPSSLAPPRLRNFLQFSLAGYIFMLLSAGLVGTLCYHAIRIGTTVLLDEEQQRMYSCTKQYVDLKYSERSYADAVGDWHSNYAGKHLVDRNCVELAMRRADRISFASAENQLPRMQAFKQAGDELVAYEVQDPKAGSTRYVYLFRNDTVLFSATLEPGDKNWSERSMSLAARMLADLPQKLQGYAVLAAMLLVLMLGAGFVLLRGLVRYLCASARYRASSRSRLLAPGATLHTEVTTADETLPAR